MRNMLFNRCLRCTVRALAMAVVHRDAGQGFCRSPQHPSASNDMLKSHVCQTRTRISPGHDHLAEVLRTVLVDWLGATGVSAATTTAATAASPFAPPAVVLALPALITAAAAPAAAATAATRRFALPRLVYLLLGPAPLGVAGLVRCPIPLFARLCSRTPACRPESELPRRYAGRGGGRHVSASRRW